MALLEVQICSYGTDGLDRLSQMNFPTCEDVIYTISLQFEGDTLPSMPKALIREDIRILTHRSRGLSINRNFAIENAVGDILLIADDDLIFTKEGFDYILYTFQKHPELDYASFMHKGESKKQYPAVEHDFANGEPKGYYLTSFELAFRRKSLPADIRFSKHLGVGAPYFGAGEENVFLLRMQRRGLKGKFFPYIIVEHPGATTGTREATPASLRSQGLWLRFRFGVLGGFPRLIRNVPRCKTNPFAAFRHMAIGFLAMKKFIDRNGNDR